MFVFQGSTRAAVDQWIDYMDDILGTAPFNRPLGIALDTRESGTLPLGYAAQRLADLFANYDKRPPLRIALISDQSAIIIILIQMLAQIAASDDQNTVQYHHSNDENEAFHWLLEAS